MQNIEKRGKVYYVRAQVDGFRLYRSTGTGDARLAAKRARAMIEAARGRRFEALEQTKARKNYAKLGKVFQLYRIAAKKHGIAPRVIRDYIYMLSYIVRRVHGEDVNVERMPSSILNRDLIETYVEDVLESAGESELDQDRARRTIRSTVTQARAIFSKWAMDAYRDIKLPDLEGFRAAGRVRATPKTYSLPPQPLIDKTVKAGLKLQGKDSGLYRVFLLAYYLGMRPGEIAASEWCWLRDDNTGRFLDIRTREGFRPKHGHERSIPLADDVWKALTNCRENGDRHILPGDHATDRSDLVKRTFAAWMRKLGWKRDSYPKAAHELRKLAGSRWYTERGAEAAQTWLGHKSVTTTCNFYATLTRKGGPKPLGME